MAHLADSLVGWFVWCLLPDYLALYLSESVKRTTLLQASQLRCRKPLRGRQLGGT